MIVWDFSHKVNNKLLFLLFGSLADGDIVTLICISWMTGKTEGFYVSTGYFYFSFYELPAYVSREIFVI